MSDQILIKNLFLRTIIGVNDDERSNRQDVLINLVLDVDTRDTEGDVLLLGCDGGRLVANGPPVPLFRRSVALHEAHERSDSPALVAPLRHLAFALIEADRARDALPHALRSLEIARTQRQDHFEIALTLNTLGVVERELGRHDDAGVHLRAALESVDRSHADADRLLGDVNYNQARVLLAQQQLDEAERLLDRATDHERSYEPVDSERLEDNRALRAEIAAARSRNETPPGPR